MSNWKNWYDLFLENKRNKELNAFSAGLKGEKFIEQIIIPQFDSNSNWNDLIKLAESKLKPEFQIVNFDYKDNKVVTDNPIIQVCFEKSIKNNYYYNSNQILIYLIFNYLKSIKINDVVHLIKCIREIPEESFLQCNNCNHTNDLGWENCANCQINIENSFEN